MQRAAPLTRTTDRARHVFTRLFSERNIRAEFSSRSKSFGLILSCVESKDKPLVLVVCQSVGFSAKTIPVLRAQAELAIPGMGVRAIGTVLECHAPRTIAKPYTLRTLKPGQLSSLESWTAKPRRSLHFACSSSRKGQ